MTSPWDDWEEAGQGKGWKFADNGDILIECNDCDLVVRLGGSIRWKIPYPEMLEWIRGKHSHGQDVL